MKVRIIAPARTFDIINNETFSIAEKWFKENNFEVTFWKACLANDQSIKWRVSDIHEAFLDSSVNYIFSAIWWHTTIEIINHLNFDLIKNNPKFICWYSDISILLNAIFIKTWLITYYGPHFSSLWIKHWNTYTITSLLQYMTKNDVSISYMTSKKWSDDEWYIDQENRKFITNSGIKIINFWSAMGEIVWWNLSSFNLLRWTDYIPSLKDKILILEDARTFWDLSYREFKRNFYSLMNDSNAKYIKWLLVGRFQLNDWFDEIDFINSIRDFDFLKNIPIALNLDFWHTYPIFTIPIGWMTKIKFLSGAKPEIIFN